MCLETGRVVPAAVADHIEPHHGDEKKFWFGKLQSLCREHHDRAKRSEEMRGYSTRIGLDGYPVDKKHPFYQEQRFHKGRRKGVVKVTELLPPVLK